MAFRLAVHMREKQVVYRTMGSLSILWGIIPKYDPFAGSYYDLENAANVGAGAFIWYYSGRRRNLEEVLTVGVAAYNKSLQEEAKAPYVSL
jgi:hypothetical protein